MNCLAIKKENILFDFQRFIIEIEDIYNFNPYMKYFKNCI